MASRAIRSQSVARQKPSRSISVNNHNSYNLSPMKRKYSVAAKYYFNEGIPYEVYTYGILLKTVYMSLLQQFSVLSDQFYSISASFQRHKTILTFRRQSQMKQCKNGLAKLNKHIEACINVLSTVLEDEKLLSYLNLTLLSKSPALYSKIYHKEDRNLIKSEEMDVKISFLFSLIFEFLLLL